MEINHIRIGDKMRLIILGYNMDTALIVVTNQYMQKSIEVH